MRRTEKKFITLLALFFLSFLTGCGLGSNRNKTVSNGNYGMTIKELNEGIASASDAQPQPLPDGNSVEDTSDSSGKNIISVSRPGVFSVFRSGIWIGGRKDLKYCYYIFESESKTVWVIDTGDGSVEEAGIADISKYREFTDVSYEMLDEDHIISVRQSGTQYDFWYVGEASEDFAFYSEQDLCSMALEHCWGSSEAKSSYAKVEDRNSKSVMIKVYYVFGETSIEKAAYEIDRRTASGSDLKSGETVSFTGGTEKQKQESNNPTERLNNA